MTEIFESSEKAKQDRKDNQWWELLEVGQSFAIPLDQGKLANLRSKAWTIGKKLNRKFRIIQHNNCYEVARKA